MRTEEERETQKHIGEEITLSDDHQRRFRRTHDRTSVWDELTLEVLYKNKDKDPVWLEVASVSYITVNKVPKPYALSILIFETTGPEYRSYSNSGQLSRYKEPYIFDGDEKSLKEVKGVFSETGTLRDSINFIDTVRKFEERMKLRDYSFPPVYTPRRGRI